jgi:hypothetical protein
MVMTHDYWSRYTSDGEIPKGNLSKPAPINYLRERAHPDDAPGPHVHIHQYNEDDCACDAETEDRISSLERAMANVIRDHYSPDDLPENPLL